MLSRWRLLIGAAIPVVVLSVFLGLRMSRTPAGETVSVPLRDGTMLSATVYQPDGDGPWPVILFRSPVPLPVDAWPFVRRGYAVVVQVSRIRAGDPRPYRDREDGYDTVEWIAQQPFANGRVGVAGHAEVGYLAYLTASAAPPSLKTAFVSHAPASLRNEGHFIGGILRAADVLHLMQTLRMAPEDIEAYRRAWPWSDQWAAGDFATHASTTAVPIYHATAWYDPGVRGALRVGSRLHTAGPSGARGQQRILVRPAVRAKPVGDLNFPGATADEDMFGWLDGTLKGDGSAPWTGVRYYLSGPARSGFRSKLSGYRAADAWPPPGGEAQRWFLSAGGALGRAAPTVATSSTGWRFAVVPTAGGRHAALPSGPSNLAVLGGAGAAQFVTAPMKAPVTLIGDVAAELYLPEQGGDVVVRLADVYPDGYAAWIAEGALRPRRAAKRSPHRVDLGPVAVQVGAGHRLAVYLTSTSRPALDPDLEGFGPKGPQPGVHHDADRPSALILPVHATVPPKLD